MIFRNTHTKTSLIVFPFRLLVFPSDNLWMEIDTCAGACTIVLCCRSDIYIPIIGSYHNIVTCSFENLNMQFAAVLQIIYYIVLHIECGIQVDSPDMFNYFFFLNIIILMLKRITVDDIILCEIEYVSKSKFELINFWII